MKEGSLKFKKFPNAKLSIKKSLNSQSKLTTFDKTGKVFELDKSCSKPLKFLLKMSELMVCDCD